MMIWKTATKIMTQAADPGEFAKEAFDNGALKVELIQGRFHVDDEDTGVFNSGQIRQPVTVERTKRAVNMQPSAYNFAEACRAVGKIGLNAAEAGKSSRKTIEKMDEDYELIAGPLIVTGTSVNDEGARVTTTEVIESSEVIEEQFGSGEDSEGILGDPKEVLSTPTNESEMTDAYKKLVLGEETASDRSEIVVPDTDETDPIFEEEKEKIESPFDFSPEPDPIVVQAIEETSAEPEKEATEIKVEMPKSSKDLMSKLRKAREERELAASERLKNSNS